MGLSPRPSSTLRVTRVPTLTLTRCPPEDAANNCGHPPDLSGLFLGAHPLKLAWVPLITRGIGSGVDTLGKVGKHNVVIAVGQCHVVEPTRLSVEDPLLIRGSHYN